MTPTAGLNKVDFSTTVDEGYLSFACAAKIADAPTLTYKMSGTDEKAFKLSTTTVSVTKKDAVAFDKNAKVDWALDAASTAPLTKMKGKCPDVGSAFGWFAPLGTAAPSQSTITSTARAAIKL